MQGRALPVPGRYSWAIAIMEEMSWSWDDLMAAPFDLVEEIACRMEKRAHWLGVKEKMDQEKARKR